MHERNTFELFAAADLVVRDADFLSPHLVHGHGLFYCQRDAHGVVGVHHGRTREYAPRTREFTSEGKTHHTMRAKAQQMPGKAVCWKPLTQARQSPMGAHLTKIEPFILQIRVATANSNGTGVKPSRMGVASRMLASVYAWSRAAKSILSSTLYSTANEPSACRCFAFNRSALSWMAWPSRPIRVPTADSLPTKYCPGAQTREIHYSFKNCRT